MRNLILGMLITSVLPAIAADGTQSSPHRLVMGDNPINFGSSSSVFYSITPPSDQLIILTFTNSLFYGQNITSDGEFMYDSFNGVSYIQTKGGESYLLEVSKGWGAGNANIEVECHDKAYPDGFTWDSAVTPAPYMSFLPLGAVVPCHMVYTPAEDGILLFNFSASPSVTYANRQFADNETEGINRLATEYISGGGYRGHMEVKGGQTYWFRVKGQISMLCSAELIHPQIGATPDFPYQVGPGSDIPFPKEAGKYYYRIANNGNSGYLVISGNDNFNGTATSGTSFDYPTETSTDRIHLRMSVTSGYPSYCLILDRTEAAGADQLFSAVYSNEPYDQFPGMAINENTPVETAGYPGAYYYRFTVPQDGRTIININPSDRPETSATQTRLFYANNAYSPLATGQTISYEGVAGREFTVAWNVDASDAPLTFSVTFTAPPSGDSPNNPIDVVAGENKIPVGKTKYFRYTATKDCKLVITPAENSGLGTPAVSMLPVPEDPYMQACEVSEENGSYLVNAQKNRGYLIIFNNIETETSFTVAERSNSQGDAHSNPFIINGNKATLPLEPGIYWYEYTVPATGKLEIATDLTYQRAANHQDYTFVYYFTPADLNNRAGELRPDLDNATFVTRVLNVTEGDVFYLQVRTITPQDGTSLTFLTRGPIEGEVPELAIPIPFNGSDCTYDFTRIINHVEDGLWYSIPLTPGKFSLQSMTDDSFDIALFAPGNTDTPITETEILGVDYDEENEKYVYFYGFNNIEIAREGKYLMFLSDCGSPFTASISLSQNGSIDAASVNNRINLTSGTGYLEISAPDCHVTVCDISGKTIAERHINGTYRLTLPSGIYIVRTGTSVFKTSVR